MSRKLKYRKFHKLYAFIFGYFWKPCIICGKEFGGHEKRGNVYFWLETRNSGKIVCPECADTQVLIDHNKKVLGTRNV